MHNHKRLFLTCIFTNILFSAAIFSALIYLRAEAADQKAAAAQSAPYLITYRGLVSDFQGPVNGQKDLGFRVFAQEAGGVPLWAENHAGIEVRAGEFSVIIGSTGVPSGTLPADLFSAPDRWLEIVVDGSTLEPRQRFTSVPYALNAQNAAYATEALTATYVLSGSSGLPSGALVWLSEDQAPDGYVRVDGPGKDIGAWDVLPELPAGVSAVSCNIWTGTEFICWNANEYATNPTGARYNPQSNAWTEMSTIGAPSARSLASVIWTGQEMFVWGGQNATVYLNTGARYNPQTDTWLPVSTVGAPEGRIFHAAVWTGQEVLIWGGVGDGGAIGSGARYNPATDTWTTTSGSNAPTPRYNMANVWSGQELIICNGGDGSVSPNNSGGRYNPLTDTWQSISSNPNLGDLVVFSPRA